MSLFVAPTLGLVLTLGSPPVVDFGVGSHGEAGAGYIPVSASEPSSPAVQVSVDLQGGMRLHGPRSELVLRTGPRVYGLAPNQLDAARPLFFYVGDGSYRVDFARRWTFDANLDLGAGELSYVGQRAFFDPGTGSIDASVVPVVLGQGGAGLGYRASRTHTLGISSRASFQQPFHALAPNEGLDLVPTVFGAGGSLVSAHELSAVDGLSFLVDVDAFLNRDEPAILTTGGRLRYRRNLDPRNQVTTSAGAEWIHSTGDDGDRVLPTLEVGLDHTGPHWTVSGAAGVRGFFDQLAFVYVPQTFVRFGATRTWREGFTSAVTFTFSTSLVEIDARTGIFGTTAIAELPNQIELSPTVDLTFGARSVVRGPDLGNFSVERSQGEFVVYVGFVFSEGTDRERGRFMR